MNCEKNLTFSQTYTAKVTSVLPVLLSAIRVSPPSEGPAHDGKTIGKDALSYEYKQVWPRSISKILDSEFWSLNLL
jgi:leukotriene-A4 hydrolase